MSRAGDEKRRENAVVEKAEKTWTEKSKKWLTNGGGGCIIFLVSSASVLRAKPNSGDLHSGSAVDSDSTCGSSILSSPTKSHLMKIRWLFCFPQPLSPAPVQKVTVFRSRNLQKAALCLVFSHFYHVFFISLPFSGTQHRKRGKLRHQLQLASFST